MRNRVADGANRILRKTMTAVKLKYLRNFWRSLKMPKINWKVELKLKLKHFCILSAVGGDYDGAKSNNIVFTIKYTSQFISRIQAKSVKTS